MDDSIQIYYKLGQIETGITSLNNKIDALADSLGGRLTAVETVVRAHEKEKWLVRGGAAVIAALVSFLFKAFT